MQWISLSVAVKKGEKFLLTLHVGVVVYFSVVDLKGKFSSGIEGALASTLNNDFNWKQLLEMILCIFLLMFSKFIWVTLIQKQQKYK